MSLRSEIPIPPEYVPPPRPKPRKELSRKKIILMIVVITLIGIIGVAIFFQYVLLPVMRTIGETVRKEEKRTFALAEVTFLSDSNRTYLLIDNISGRELYNVTLIPEFGKIYRMEQKFKPGKEVPEPNLARIDRLGIGFNGKISKVTIRYSFEPYGETLEETLEWTW